MTDSIQVLSGPDWMTMRNTAAAIYTYCDIIMNESAAPDSVTDDDLRARLEKIGQQTEPLDTALNALIPEILPIVMDEMGDNAPILAMDDEIKRLSRYAAHKNSLDRAEMFRRLTQSRISAERIRDNLRDVDR